MRSTINLKQSNLAAKLLKRTASLIGSSVGSYFSEALPTTSSIATQVGSEAKGLMSSINKQTKNSVGTLRQLRQQMSVKNILRWYLDEEDDLSNTENMDNEIDFDTSVDKSEAQIVKAEISESTKNAKEIQMAVVKSSHKLMEAQISHTANILTAMHKQTATITTGFDAVNNTLGKILEVVTKNTAALIETTALAVRDPESQTNAGDDIITDGFSLRKYKNVLKRNFQNSEYGMVASFAKMFLDPGNKLMRTPDMVVSWLFDNVMSKKAPKLKNNLKALDESLNNIIVDSLIRLGTNTSWSDGGKIGRILGIDPRRKSTDTSRNSLEVKAVPFDSIVHESITNAIPGYLRKILVQLGGKDEVYDYKSRSFKSSNQIKKDFFKKGMNAGSLQNADKKVRNIMGNDDFATMIYDLMLTDIGSNRMYGDNGRNLLESFGRDPKKFRQYVEENLLKNQNLTMKEKVRLNQMGKNFNKSSNYGQDIMMQAARNNVKRNATMERYVRELNSFNTDLSFIDDSKENQFNALLQYYGKKGSKINGPSIQKLSGTDYSNLALYKIFTRLDRGINVFQVGSKNLRNTPFKSMKRELPAPLFYKKQSDSQDDVASSAVGNIRSMASSKYDEEENLLRNGEDENLTKMDRFKRWGSDRGGKLKSALFSGDPYQVKAAFGLIVRDVSQVTGDTIKSGLANVNRQYGNISGFLKHKMFGTEYTYQDGVDEQGNPIIKKVNKNEKGGLLGFVSDYFKDSLKNTKESASRWLNDVKGYFDYDKAPGDDNSVIQKRRKLLFASAGALAGAGLLGGPIGLVMGAVAGNAIEELNISKRLKELLFGRDEKGKAKGILTRLGDNIVDPIHYEISKTVHNVGNVLKRRILGPLSDIGLAIKDRIASAAETRFGKVFKFIGKLITAPFRKVGNFIYDMIKFPIKLFGGLARGGTSAAGFVAGSLLSGISSGIAGKSQHVTTDENGNVIVKSTKDILKERREARKQDVKNNKFSDYKSWKEKKNAHRAERFSKFGDYFTEEISTLTQEEVEILKQQQETSKHIEEDVNTLARLGSEKGSIYTHDQGIHDKLDNIFEMFNVAMFGKVKGAFRKPKLLGSENGIVESSVISAVTVASGDETITSDEYRLTTNIIDEASKENPNKRSVFSKLKQLMTRNNLKKKDGVEKKESIFDKIREMLGGMGFPNLPGILGSIGAALALIAGLTGNLDNVLGNLGNAIHKFFGGDTNKEDAKNQDSVDRGLNSVAALFGFQVGNKFDFANPFAKLYHYNTDGAGGKIVEKNKTKAKSNLQFWTPMKESISNALKGKSSLHTKPSNVIKNTGKNFARIGVLSGMSNLVGAGVKKLAMMAGANEQQGEAIGGAATTATAAGLAINMATSKIKGKTSMVDNVVSFLRNVFSKIGSQLIENEKLAKYGKDISRKFDQLFNKSIKKITNDVATTISNAISRATGKEFTKEAASGFLAGVPIVLGGVYGLMSGLLTSEHLFGVGPDKADGLMATIAGIMQGTFGALEWVPVIGMFVAVLDVFDKFVFATIFGKSFEQIVAEFLYNILQGDSGAELLRKQKHMETLRDDYNKRTGKKLNAAEFNDLVNRKDAVDNFLWGKASYNAAGGIYMDEGGRVPYSGLAGKISSNEGDYAKDEKGNVLKDRFGNSIINVDASGNEKVKGAKFGNKIAETFNGFNRALFGGVKYKTDENGNAKILDAKNGLYEVEGYDEGFFAKLFKSRNEVSTGLKASIMDDVATDMTILEKKSKEEKKQNQFDYSKKYDWGNDGRKMTLKEWFEENSISLQKALMFKSFNGLNDTINSPSFNTNNNFALAGAGGYNSFNPAANYLLNKNNNVSTPNNKKSAGFNFLGFRLGGPLDIIGGNPLSKDVEITSDFGWRGNENHKGIDLIPKDRSNDADVLSTMNGRILSVKNNIQSSITGLNYSGNNSGGNEVIIQGDDGLIYKNYHLKSGSIPSNLKPGTRVQKGQTVGKMGSTGRSGGSHLHYQIEAPLGNGRYVPINPLGRIGGAIKNFSKRIGDAVANEFETWINIVADIKQQIASRKRGYVLGGNVMELQSNGFKLSIRTDCSGYVSACVSCLKHKRYEFSTRSQKTALAGSGFIEAPFPGWDKLYQGDILLSNNHTEIFSHNEGNQHYVWNCGSNNSCNSPVPTISGGGPYHTIFRLASSTGQMINPVQGFSSLGAGLMSSGAGSSTTGILGALSNLGQGLLYTITGGLIGSNPNQQSTIGADSSLSASNFSPVGGGTLASADSKGLWDYFKSLGYSDIEAAAILGAWKPESGHNPKKVEWDESKAFKSTTSHDRMLDDRQSLNDFTLLLFNQYAKQGLRINKEAYKANDGLYYPGIGFSQWTGGRAKELLDYAKQNNMKWYDPKVQLSFMDNELKNKRYYQTVREKMQKSKTLDEATGQFVKWYVGYAGGEQEARKAAARDFYKQFSASSPTPGNVRIGGPLDDTNFISSFNKESNFKTFDNRLNINKINPFSNKTFKLGGNSLEINPQFNRPTDITPIIDALKTIIIHLASISNNTNSSNDLLTNLNEKDFVDKGLRDTINAFKSSKPPVKQNSYSSARSVAALARP